MLALSKTLSFLKKLFCLGEMPLLIELESMSVLFGELDEIFVGEAFKNSELNGDDVRRFQEEF